MYSGLCCFQINHIEELEEQKASVEQEHEEQMNCLQNLIKEQESLIDTVRISDDICYYITIDLREQMVQAMLIEFNIFKQSRVR